MDANTINAVGCEGPGEEGSYGLSGGLHVPAGGGTPTFLPFAPVAGGTVPEPSTLFLLGSGLLGLAGAAWRQHRK